jgi:hypothetical protein
MSTARLEIVVGSGGVMVADKALKQLTATAKDTEKQKERLAIAAERAAAAAEKQAAAAVRQAQREADAWNDAKQKALARYDKQAEAAERAAQRQAAAAERAAKREEEAWSRAIQRAKAGLDGVLPIRPSLQRIEAELASKRGAATEGSGIATGAKEGAMSALGIGALAGGATAVAAMGIEKLAEGVKHLKDEVIADFVADDKLIARLGGITDSAEQASETFGDLEKQTLGKLPSTVDEVANAFIQLGNNGLQNSQQALKAYSNVAAQTGASLGAVTSAVQAASLGNYKSLREFGIKVKEEGDSLKVTFRGQTETIAGGADAIEGYMQRLGAVQFAGAVERQMDTVGGSIKKADDAWEKLINAIGDSSLGDVVKSSVGASISIVDAATASVDALFGKTQQFKREAESAKRQREADDKLDATMRSWADPTVSKSETARLAASIAESQQSSADKALAQYTRNSALVDKLRSLGETHVGDMTLKEAQSELDRQYMRDNGGTKSKGPQKKPFDLWGKLDEANRKELIRTSDTETDAYARQYETLKDSLAKQEDSFYASYESRRKFLADYYGPDSEELWQRNEELWSKHLDEVAAKSAQKQIELQHRLANIGIGPQSQVQQVHSKTAGAYYELGNALGENLSGKNGEALKLEAEQTYKEKSIAIEKERAREIAEVNRELVASSLQNAEAMFGGLTAALKNAGGEQSAAYQTMFAIQKGFGLATAEAAMFIDMAKANEAGFPANVPLYLKAAADGAQLIAQLSSLSYSGAYDSGGDVPARSRGLGGERGVEIVGPAGVIGRAETAALLGGGQRNMRLIFTTEEASSFHGSARDERVFVHWVKRNGALIRSVIG